MKKFISLIIAAVMILSLSVSSVIFNVSAEGAWDGATAATAFESGTGTEADPYVIANAEQLRYLADLINTKDTNITYNTLFYKLSADIDLGGNIWYRIGNSDLPFSGTFDGDGHKVFNFFLYEHPAGLFGVTNNATIKNLKIDDANYFATGAMAGAFVGNVATDSTLNITNCEVGANVIITIDNMKSSVRVGGIWGTVDKNTTVNAENCINRAKIVLDNTGRNDSAAGGIGGAIRAGYIKNCANLGSIVINYADTLTSNAGGIVGIAIAPGELVIENVINCANVTGWTSAGGIIGYIYTGTEALSISNAYSFTNNINVTSETGTKGTVIGGLRDGSQTCALNNVTTVAIPDMVAIGGEFTVEGNLMGEVTSPDDLSLNADYNAILTTLGLGALTMPVPPSEETDPVASKVSKIK